MVGDAIARTSVEDLVRTYERSRPEAKAEA